MKNGPIEEEVAVTDQKILEDFVKSRFTIVDEDILCYNEVSEISILSIEIFFRELKIFISSMDNCYLLVSLVEAQLPSAFIRRHISNNFRQIASKDNKLKHVAFVTGKNFIINTAARFVMHQNGIKSFSITKEKDQALAKIAEIKNG